MKPKPFATEADLCAAFLAWVKRAHPTLKAYSEWAGWDILLVYPEGWQLGIQAKLRLNAEVIGQAAPEFRWGAPRVGPDFRGVLVPERSSLAGIAGRLGLVVFDPMLWPRWRDRTSYDFAPGLDQANGYRARGTGQAFHENDWLDWNPEQRHDVPPTDTDAVAGSPCPVTLTHWKLGALAVLAELAIKGTITTKRMRELGINPGRWMTGGWLMPTDTRGVWRRGEHCPLFDQQHPTAYAHALETARAAVAQTTAAGGAE